MAIYYVKVKDKKKLVLLQNSQFSKEDFENRVLLTHMLGNATAKSDLAHGEIHTSEEVLCLRIKGRGLVSAEPEGSLQRCWGGEKVILHSNGTFEVVPTFLSKMRRYLIMRGWIK